MVFIILYTVLIKLNKNYYIEKLIILLDWEIFYWGLANPQSPIPKY